MASMLDQVIYTRSLPHRDLKKGGALEKSDGFGVYSASRQLLEPGKKVNVDLLISQLAVKNCAKEGDAVGLTRSYDFFDVGPDCQALVYEVSRPKGEIARTNGAENRAGNYVKQGFIGSFAGYPCEYFGAEAWTAHKATENSYYHDDDPSREPAWLPQVQDSPKYGHITLERIRAFVCNGRVEAVKAAVWYLIQEMEKPVNERRVLLIKDVPENVEQWVAAIHYAFSAQMARQITFSTNRTKLTSQIETILYYHADASGNYVRGMVRGPQTIRTPYCMIVGYHPQDKFSATVKQLPTSSFVILDGTAKTIGVTPDETIRRAYYNAVIQYDEDLSDFCRVVLPGLPLKGITARLPDLFDAYKYLLDSENRSERWTYEATMRHLKNLTAQGIPTNNALNEYLLTECRKVYSRFAQEDEKQDFALLKAMWKISLAIRREQDVIDCVADRLAAPLSRLQVNGGILVKSWHALKNSQLMPLVNKALREIMEDSEARDFLHVISVEGHGAYPTERVFKNPYTTVTCDDEELKWKYEYYLNECHEMDTFIGDLIDAINEADEPTVMIIYGDHIPALDVKEENYKADNLYQTRYVIWDNIGLEKEDRDITSYQSGAVLLEDAGLAHEGILFDYQQTVSEDEPSYLDDMEAIAYDMLYGKNYVFGGTSPYKPSDMKMGHKDISIKEIKKIGDRYYIRGSNFTERSIISLNGKQLSTVYLSPTLLALSEAVDPEDIEKLEVSQVDKSEEEILTTVGANEEL
jgi:hypothetical protein